MDPQEEPRSNGEGGRVGSPFLVKNKRKRDGIKGASKDHDKPPKRPRKGHGKVLRKEAERKMELEMDEWTTDVMPTSVKCRGCQKVICLDSRSRYYPGLWDKHRKKCPKIKLYEMMKVNRHSVAFDSREEDD